MSRLKDLLSANIPRENEGVEKMTVAHGDPSLANLIFVNGHVQALVDWELSTLGDPWSDIAYQCLPYYYPSSSSSKHFPKAIDPLTEGIPSEEDFIRLYAKLRAIQLPSKKDWSFYKALSLFRFASICQGVGARAAQGNASSHQARELGSVENVDFVAKKGLTIIQAALVNKPSLLASSLDCGGYAISPRVKNLVGTLQVFMERYIFPLEMEMEVHERSNDRWKVFPKMEKLKKEAQRQGLWNLFIPPEMREHILSMECLSVEEKHELGGVGLKNLEYCFMAEIMGQCIWASEVFNCNAPDTGNMEILAKYGTFEQKKLFLVPLLKGEIRSCFGMTEKLVASSDARNIQSSITRDGEEYVLTGRKWWTTGALHPNVKFCIFMGKTDLTKPTYEQQTIILVPMDAPGIEIKRQMLQFGYDDAPIGHPEMDFYRVRVPVGNVLGHEGQGFEIAQSRLGPGRLHHCMRLIGVGKRALDLAKDRLQTRNAFDSLLSEQSSVQQMMGNAAIQLRASRLLVLSAAESLDRLGGKIARHQIAAAKVFVPKTVGEIVDLCMQFHGGSGFSDDFPLARMYVAARSLRIADGPDEVHLISIGKSELQCNGEGSRL